MTPPRPVQPGYTDTISPEARRTLDRILNARMPPPLPGVVKRTLSGVIQKSTARRRGTEGVVESRTEIAGVPVRLFARPGVNPETTPRLLLNVHGGGFEVDAGSLTENIPLAARLEAAVIAVRYRLAPKHPWPAPVEDLLAVYREALKSRSADRIVVYGTSAGAVITLQFLARLKVDGLPMPAAAGVFSGTADFSRTGDCEAFLPAVVAGETTNQTLSPYVGQADRTNPMLSPLYGDLSGLPPVLLLTSTRDQFLSQTVIHRVFF